MVIKIKECETLLHINEKAGRFGGTEEYIDSLTRILSQLGVRSYFIYGRKYGEFHSALTPFHIPGLEDRNTEKNVSQQILDVVHKIQPDVVYIHNIFDWRVAQALSKPYRKYTLLWYIHDLYFTCLTELRATRLERNIACQRVLSQNCLNQITNGKCIKRYEDRNYNYSDLHSRKKLLHSTLLADVVIVISDYMKEVLIRNLPQLEGKIKVLPRQIRQHGSTTYRKSNVELHLGYIGRIVYEKGLHIALEALLMLPDQLKLTFSIAGIKENPSYWKECSKIIKVIKHERPNINIQNLGFLSYKDIDALYRTIDIVIVPSICGESFCAVAGEALANGTAVIASDIGGISTCIKHKRTGILVKPNEPSLIAAAINKLAKNRITLAKLAQEGKSMISKEFTSQKHTESLFKTILQLRSKNIKDNLYNQEINANQQ